MELARLLLRAHASHPEALAPLEIEIAHEITWDRMESHGI
jgi:hypothetical protein